MQEVELTLARLLAVVWLILWRGLAGGVVLGLAVGLVFGMVWFPMVHTAPPASISLGLGLVVGLVWYPFVIRMALRKTYKSFRIALVPPQDPVSAPG
jgi:hypothetical protein